MKHDQERLKAAIDEADLTQAAAAELLGVSEATFSRVINGTRELTLTEAQVLSAELQKRLGRKKGLGVDELFGNAAQVPA
jgi:plasmid maintenance system antidote protein VapI